MERLEFNEEQHQFHLADRYDRPAPGWITIFKQIENEHFPMFLDMVNDLYPEGIVKLTLEQVKRIHVAFVRLMKL